MKTKDNTQQSLYQKKSSESLEKLSNIVYVPDGEQNKIDNSLKTCGILWKVERAANQECSQDSQQEYA